MASIAALPSGTALHRRAFLTALLSDLTRETATPHKTLGFLALPSGLNVAVPANEVADSVDVPVMMTTAQDALRRQPSTTDHLIVVAHLRRLAMVLATVLSMVPIEDPITAIKTATFASVIPDGVRVENMIPHHHDLMQNRILTIRDRLHPASQSQPLHPAQPTHVLAISIPAVVLLRLRPMVPQTIPDTMRPSRQSQQLPLGLTRSSIDPIEPIRPLLKRPRCPPLDPSPSHPLPPPYLRPKALRA